MGSDFLAVAAGRAVSGDVHRDNTYLHLLLPKLPYCRLLVCKSCFQTACWVQAEPRSPLPLAGPCSRLAQELLHDRKGSVLMVTQPTCEAVPHFFRDSSPVPSCFQPGSSSLQQGKLNFCLHAKQRLPVPFLCLLSSAGTWIPSLTMVTYCRSFPALSSAMRFLLS